MKLRDIYLLGRYRTPDGRLVNVRKGREVDGGWDVLFYLFRQHRVIIGENDFYREWVKILDADGNRVEKFQ